MLHELTDASRNYSFAASHEPALTIAPGDAVRFHTRDCFDGQVPMEPNPDNLTRHDRARGNPATGPVFIRGAEPGHALVSTIQSIDLAPQGLLGASNRDGADRWMAVVDIRDGMAHVDGWTLPIRPIVGVMGVAPEVAEIPNTTPGPHGGNLDSPDLGIGSRLYLPVFHQGALFACGDVHALQGDGEVCGQGIEIAARVTVAFELLPRPICPWPVVETSTHYDIIACGADLDEAAEHALLAARDFLIRYGGATDQQAIALMSIVGDLRICQIVNPLLAVRACIPRELVTREL